MASQTPALGCVVRGQQALRRQFPNVEPDALEAFAEAFGGEPDPEVVSALAEMQREAMAVARSSPGAALPTRRCKLLRGAAPVQGAEVDFEGGRDPPCAGTVLLLEGLGERCDNKLAAALAVPSGEVLALESHADPICFLAEEYGMHELRLETPQGEVQRCRFMVTSQLGDFAAALDHFHNACDWVWDGNWTEDLEEATMGLLAALDDHFESLEAGMTRSPMGSTMMSELAPSRKRLENNLAKALEHHDAQTVGRVYGAVRSLLSSQTLLDMFAPMLGRGSGVGPLEQSALYESVLAFEKARFEASSDAKRAEVKSILNRLILAADAHVAELQGGRSSDFATKWRGQLRETLVHMRDEPEAVIHPFPFQQLRGGSGGYIADMMKNMMDSWGGGQAGPVSRAETIEAVSTLKPSETYLQAEAKVSRWAESLVDESVGFGTPMSPFEVHAGDAHVRTVMAAMQSLLSLGFGYVTQGAEGAETSRMVALLDRVRATLPLDAQDEFLKLRQRRDRLKDVCRVVRAARKKGQRLSLTVNTDFQGALRALKQHHSDSWVGPSLEAVWGKLALEHQAFVFELWLHADADAAPRLVAADFGHPHTSGQAYYVATRFFDREFRNLQPGFVLAFAEAECLRRAGFALWDLGGADSSPMMQYKPQVAIEMDRSDFLRRLRECGRSPGGQAEPPESSGKRRALQLTDEGAALPANGQKVPTGMVFADVSEEELWGAEALKALEGRAKALLDAAAAAAKKVQKPTKAEKAAAKGRAPPAGAAERPKPTKPTQESGYQAVQAPLAPAAEAAAGPDDAKAAAKQQFMIIFQKLLAEGVPQNDAAAQALQVISTM